MDIINKLIASVQNDNIKAHSGSNNKFDRSSYRFLSMDASQNVLEGNAADNKIYSAVSYVPGLTECLTKTCEYFVPEVKVAMRPVKKVGNFFAKMKHPIPMKQNSGLVNKINCKQCSKVYIGETIQKLQKRLD